MRLLVVILYGSYPWLRRWSDCNIEGQERLRVCLSRARWLERFRGSKKGFLADMHWLEQRGFITDVKVERKKTIGRGLFYSMTVKLPNYVSLLSPSGD